MAMNWRTSSVRAAAVMMVALALGGGWAAAQSKKTTATMTPVAVAATPVPAPAGVTIAAARIGDLAVIEGVRSNPLIGYGLVVGLNGTGDRQQTIFTVQTLASVLQRMGVQVPAGTVRVNNAAAVFVTASLPPFADPGTALDVTVASTGDAKSLDGGMLLLTPLYAPDGQAYASAQGPLTVGGYSVGVGGNTRQMNHPTVARVPRGALVERAAVVDLKQFKRLTLSLREADFSEARDIAEAINQEFGTAVATAEDSRRITVEPGPTGMGNMAELLARIENLPVAVHVRSKVVVNERTGTIVMGRNVRLSAVSVLHGNLAIEISTKLRVSQPEPFSQGGKTTVVPETTVRAAEGPARRIELVEGSTVDELANGLQSIGATARDVVAILQAIKAAGALQAELEVI
jgi:flagellar P-ring protein precursor FlgI